MTGEVAMSTDSVSCLLPDQEQEAERADLSYTVFPHVQEVRELEDGYAFTFPVDASLANTLLDLVFMERACCPFHDMEIRFDRDHGPMTMTFRGPPGSKEMTRETLREVGVPLDANGSSRGAEGAACSIDGCGPSGAALGSGSDAVGAVEDGELVPEDEAADGGWAATAVAAFLVGCCAIPVFLPMLGFGVAYTGATALGLPAEVLLGLGAALAVTIGYVVHRAVGDSV